MNKPEVVRFEAKLFKQNNRLVLPIPAAEAAKLRDMQTVEGMINTQRFRAALIPQEDGSWVLPVNAAMQRGSGASAGDTVSVAVLGPEPDPLPPQDLQAEFDMSPEAVANWEQLTMLGKRDWIRWIEDTKSPETRARRVARTVEQLSKGKRRACCVNVYGFMECRIQEDSKKHYHSIDSADK